MDLRFALIREGNSDDGLIPHIRVLLMRAGARSVVGAPRQYTGSTRSRIQQVMSEDPSPELIFVHRDADARDSGPRHREIADAALALGCSSRVVGVVPVQELEAWLLTDEMAIRWAVGRPSGRSRVALPPIARIESTSSPKELLQEACLTASEKSGARRKKEKAQFSTRRRMILDRLDIDGSVMGLPSWQRFVEDLKTAAAFALAGAQATPVQDSERSPAM